MKKLLFAAIAVFAFGFTNAQETKFGVKAGVDLATIKVKMLGTTASASETGFFLGAFANLGVSEKFSRFQTSKQKDRVNGTLIFPELNDLVSDKLIDNRLALSNAESVLSIAERSALRRYREAANSVLGVLHG